MRRSWLIYTVLYAFFLSTMAWGELRKATKEDFLVGNPDNTYTSPGGHVGHYISNQMVSPFAVDVRDFGAVLDNTTDDSTAFTLAVAAANPNGTVVITGPMAMGSNGWAGLAFTYLNNVSIIGVGKGSIRLLFNPTQQPLNDICTGCYYPAIHISHSTGIRIKDLLFDTNGLNKQIFFLDNVTGGEVSGNTFLNHNTGVVSGFPNTASARSKYIRWENNTWDNNGYALGLGLGYTGYLDDGAVVIGNVFRDLRGSGIQGTWKNTDITGNTFINGINSINLGGCSEMGTNNSITGNVFRNLTSTAFRQDSSCGNYNQWMTVSNNTMDNMLGGITPSLSKNYVMTGNIMTNIASVGIGSDHMDNAIISGNRISGTAASNISGIYVTQSLNYIIDGNYVDGFSSGSGIYVSDYVYVDNTSTGWGIISNNIAQGNNWGVFLAGTVFGQNKVLLNNNVMFGNISYDFRTDRIDQVYGINNVYSTLLNTNNGPNLKYYVGSKAFSYGSAAPTDNTISAATGDIVWNTGTDNVIGWKCTVAGSPGTWGAMQTVIP